MLYLLIYDININVFPNIIITIIWIKLRNLIRQLFKKAMTFFSENAYRILLNT